MAKTEAFNDLEHVRAHKLRLRAERDRVQEGLKSQLDLVREPEFRRALMGDAFGDMLQAWRPLKSIGRLLGGPADATSKTLGAVLGARAKTPTGRAMVALASFVIPALLEKFGKDPGAFQEKLSHELQVSWDRVKEYVAERRQAYERSTSEE